jgi:hypothetical protein
MMTQTATAADRDLLDILFGPATQVQTYLNVLYLLLAFPLGIAYFVFLITGISFAAGMLIIFIGFPILYLVLMACRALGALERGMASSMLNIRIPPPAAVPAKPGFWQGFKAIFANTLTWKSFFYLLLKFPFGIVSFVLVVTTLATSVGLILAPLTIGITTLDFGWWQVDSKDEATVWCLVGVVLLILSMHLMNGLARVWGRFAQIMLGPDDPVPAAPSR